MRGKGAIARGLGLAAATALANAGCGARHAAPPTPAHAVARRFAEAERLGDPRAAYALLSTDVKKRVPYDEFVRRWQRASVERARQAADLEAALGEGARLSEQATVTLADGKRLGLVHERGAWKMDAALVSSRRASTPHDALRLLLGAIEKRSFEGVMRILEDERRKAIAETLEAFERGLRLHLGDEIEVSDNAAVLQWSDGRHRFRIHLVREGSEWRIDRVVF